MSVRVTVLSISAKAVLLAVAVVALALGSSFCAANHITASRRPPSPQLPSARASHATDASQEQTDVSTFDVLEPIGDGFRNYLRAEDPLSPETRLLDRANLLKLTAPEMRRRHGAPAYLRSDSGPEFVSHAILQWLDGTPRRPPASFADD